MNKFNDHRDCKYHPSVSSLYMGYCFLPEYKLPDKQLLVECKGLPCDKYEEGDE